jgi:hypothetical protein
MNQALLKKSHILCITTSVIPIYHRTVSMSQGEYSSNSRSRGWCRDLSTSSGTSHQITSFSKCRTKSYSASTSRSAGHRLSTSVSSKGYTVESVAIVSESVSPRV